MNILQKVCLRLLFNFPSFNEFFFLPLVATTLGDHVLIISKRYHDRLSLCIQEIKSNTQRKKERETHEMEMKFSLSDNCTEAINHQRSCKKKK